MNVDILGILGTLPAELIYAAVFLVVGIGSLGVPSPIQTVVASASFLAASQSSANPWIIWFLGTAGAIVGGFIGYFAGIKHGYRLLEYFERQFPKHVNKRSIHLSEKAFHHHGVKTIFLGRALTGFFRIFAGPVAGVFKLSKNKFFYANITSAVFWCGITVWGVYYFGLVADKWLDQLSWVVFVLSLIVGAVISVVFTKKFEQYLERMPED